MLRAERRSGAPGGGRERRTEQRVVDRDPQQRIGLGPGDLEPEALERVREVAVVEEPAERGRPRGGVEVAHDDPPGRMAGAPACCRVEGPVAPVGTRRRRRRVGAEGDERDRSSPCMDGHLDRRLAERGVRRVAHTVEGVAAEHHRAHEVHLVRVEGPDHGDLEPRCRAGELRNVGLDGIEDHEHVGVHGLEVLAEPGHVDVAGLGVEVADDDPRRRSPRVAGRRSPCR